LETYVLIHGFGPVTGGLLSIVAGFFTLVVFLLWAYIHGCVERFLQRRRSK
jgi:hypothetical protein